MPCHRIKGEEGADTVAPAVEEEGRGRGTSSSTCHRECQMRDEPETRTRSASSLACASVAWLGRHGHGELRRGAGGARMQSGGERGWIEDAGKEGGPEHIWTD